MEIDLTIPGTPIGKGRPRFTRSGHAYTPEKTAAYEQTVRECWKQQSGQRFPEGAAIMACIIAWFPIPKSVSRKKAAAMWGAYHTARPDADNVAKAVLDALNGFAYADDSAVQIACCYKMYTVDEPRLELTLRSAEEARHGA